MLRLPKLQLAEPATIGAALALLSEAGKSAMPIAGGTDVLVNLKHELYDVDLLVSLARIPELHGIQQLADGTLRIGAMTPLESVAADERVRAEHAVLAQATSLVAGPQHRRMGTLGGNLMLDTRCRWINQSHFWRQALGYCLKKDGSLCHVVEGGQKCVAAASNDSAPALMALDARLHLEAPEGPRVIPVDELWKGDGIDNKKLRLAELLVAIELPPPRTARRSAYGKLRERGSIDFPLLGLAVRLDLDAQQRISDVQLVAVALAARPTRVKGLTEVLAGHALSGPAFEAAVEQAAAQAHKQLHTLPNIPGDADWRRAMIPVYTRRTLLAAAAGSGPVHHL